MKLLSVFSFTVNIQYIMYNNYIVNKLMVGNKYIEIWFQSHIMRQGVDGCELN